MNSADDRAILHILTSPNDDLAADIIALQRQCADHTVKIVDLTEADPDYRQLLQEIFAADSIQVW